MTLRPLNLFSLILAVLLPAASGARASEPDTLLVPGPSGDGPSVSPTLMMYLNVGVQKSAYARAINRFLPDHYGPTFELEAGIDWKAVAYFSPWTLNPESTMRIWKDTLYDYDQFNPIKAGLLFGKRIFVLAHSEWGLTAGAEWVTLSGFKKKEEREGKKVEMPTTAGGVIGLDYHRDLIMSRILKLGVKLSYRYTTPDYRVYNSALDYGTHEFSVMIGIGGKSALRPLRPASGETRPRTPPKTDPPAPSPVL